MLPRTDTLAVIITYKNPMLLNVCLESLEGQCDHVVIDNSPPAENLLYTRAVNNGLKYVQDDGYKYALIVCDDVILGKDCVSSLSLFLDENPRCALAAPLQTTADGRVTCGGVLDAFPGGVHITAPLSDPLYEKPFQQNWANGACFLLRLSAVRECGLLDENMRFVCSDSDYSFTLRSRGWKVWFVPSARVTHEPNGAKTPNEFLLPICQADQRYFVSKWLTCGLYGQLAYEGPRLEKLVQNQYAALSQWIAALPPK